MARLKDQKADQKRSALALLLETKVCSDFGFIEALKCLHTFCNRIQHHARGQATDFDGHPAASRSAMPCPAPSTIQCAYMIFGNNRRNSY